MIRSGRAVWLAATAALLGACAGQRQPPGDGTAPAPAQPASAAAAEAPPRPTVGRVVSASPAVLIYLPAAGETLAAIAQRLLGDAGRAWAISQANGDIAEPRAGQPLVVPRAAPPPLGVRADGVQTVPVLSYHRFTDADSARGNKMLMPAARFEAQLSWLARERFTVLRLAELQDFIEGRRAVPPRSVVITVDDGWSSFHRHAFPLLLKHRVPVTLFVYTDIIGTRDGLSWAQLREMAQSGLVDIQAHSRSHRNLVERQTGETDAAWRRAVAAELHQPRQLLDRQLADVGVKVRHLAYPYGDVDDAVLQAVAAEPYALAFTVRAGGNAFYAAPRLLRRTMVYGDHTLDDFAARLRTRRPLSQP